MRIKIKSLEECLELDPELADMDAYLFKKNFEGGEFEVLQNAGYMYLLKLDDNDGVSYIPISFCEEVKKYYQDKDYRATSDVILHNSLYALICPRLELNESVGHNGHARTQIIIKEIAKEMDEWLEMQK